MRIKHVQGCKVLWAVPGTKCSSSNSDDDHGKDVMEEEKQGGSGKRECLSESFCQPDGGGSFLVPSVPPTSLGKMLQPCRLYSGGQPMDWLPLGHMSLTGLIS